MSTSISFRSFSRSVRLSDTLRRKPLNLSRSSLRPQWPNSSRTFSSAFLKAMEARMTLIPVTKATRSSRIPSSAELPADHELGNRDHYELNVKAGSVTMCLAPLLAPGAFLSRIHKLLPFLLRSPASSAASDSTLTLTGWATLNTTHFISPGLGCLIRKMGQIVVPTPTAGITTRGGCLREPLRSWSTNT